ncbi:hypothetical protein Q6348_04075 [Isoptericola sp. b441]|uniref:Secreted protein n=1 Tax=Actinotalea lenta TaxID=3064654 RepID=A0ABT9D7G1_9CELL|nr:MULTISPECIES: hypothetical protein [unclassified Isoptericola]MDO8106371.1 hypothetical protein [Isoptericola sp. b441]MDO8121910.1 hypothetical protein [Isoptericola sp. b490]
MRRRRGTAWVAMLVLCAGVLGVAAPTVAVASCVAPLVWVAAGEAEPVAADGTVVLHVEEPMTVSGEWFRNGCDDTGSVQIGGPGCGGPVVSRGDTESPMRDVAVVLTQGSHRWELGSADAAGAADRYALRFHTTVPTDAEPGPATLEVGPVTVSVLIEPWPQDGGS